MAFVMVSAMGFNTDSSFLMITGSDMTSMKASFISSLFSILLGADEVLVGVDVVLLERSLSFQVDMEDHLWPQGLVLTDWPQQNGSTHCSAQIKVRSSQVKIFHQDKQQNSSKVSIMSIMGVIQTGT